MYLKTLEIQGFKSFPEKTVIQFHEGVTGIVGPNGSGKSNVTDAIRWVLGEQSTKALRGSKMQDVIFTGTQSRRAMGYAEVTMIIDNNDNKMNIEYSEVAVTRRLYRSGESEYFLNKTSCRLKDILTLFMDTGLGKDGYSIVGQGRVDEILSSKSEDRRKVFEEASGIVKFKTRKDEAQRKLDNTQQNLIRINDIIGEIKEQIDPLKEQSDTAKKFLNLRDELKEIEIALFLENIDKYTAKYDEFTNEYNLLDKEIEESTFKLEEIKAKNKNFTDKIKEIDEELSNKREKLQTYVDRVKDFNSSVQFNNERIEQLKLRISNINEEGTNIDTQIKGIDDELETKRQKEKYLNEKLSEYDMELSSYEEKMSDILEKLTDSEKKAEEMKLRLDELTESLYDKKSQSKQTRAQNEMIESRTKSLENEINELMRERDSLSIQKEECQDNLLKIDSSHQESKENLENMKSELDAVKVSCTKYASSVETKKLDVENINYKVKMLNELESSMAGYSEAVKAVIKKSDSEKSLFPGIMGTVGELINVKKEYVTAIEIALGSSIQNIVTQTESQASDVIKYLKENRLGRATFLPISSVSGKVLENNLLAKVSRYPGYIGLAKDLVDFPNNLEGIANNLLGRIVIIDVLENAINIAKNFGYSFRIVTLDGDVIIPGGALSGGFQKSRGVNILGRASEIEDLQKTKVKLLEEIKSNESKSKQEEENLIKTARLVQSMEQKLNDDSHRKIREQSHLEQILQDIKRATSRIEMLKAENDGLIKQMSQIDGEANSLLEDASRIETQISDLKEELEKIHIANKSEQEKRDDLRELISDLKLSVNSIQESLTAAKELTERIENEKKSFIESIEKGKKSHEKSLEDIDNLENKNQDILEQISDINKDKENLVNEIDDVAFKRKNMDEQMSDFYERFEEISNRIGVLQSEIGKTEVKKGRMETALDEFKNKLWESYELTYDNAQKWKIEIESIQDSQKKVNDLKNQVKELGDINVNAIEEYDKISQRYDFLTKQRDDIESSRQKLIKMISEITGEMKKLFMSHFEIINENFKVVFAELFGGGMAEITLGDEEDVLNCNIDIHAQPPGKKLQNMLLLSGGERCLTAIALLFAILKLRPSPFCVLDEVEAALDDANIVRFSEYIRNYASESQFILVTHRKGTMEACDMLYGVTMQERGISKVLSMRLED